MPSPIGHALGGIAIAWAAAPRRDWRAAAIFAAVALAPDLDLLVGDHRGISHSLGAAVVAGLAGWSVVAIRGRALGRPIGPGKGVGHVKGVRPGSDPLAMRWGASVALAWGSHVLLDWLSNDTRPPVGVMALWPAGREYYKAAIEVFPPVSRRFGDARFWQHNVRAAIVELLMLTPLVWLALRAGRQRRHDRKQGWRRRYR